MPSADWRLVIYPDRASWLDARRFSIGSSDAAGLMGESRWSSPVQLNYLKRALVPISEPDPERAQALDWHREREGEIARWWFERQLFGQKSGTDDADDWAAFVARPTTAQPLAMQEEGGVGIWNPGDFTVALRVLNGVPLSATLDRALAAHRLLGDHDLWTVDADTPAALLRNLASAPAAIVAPVELKNAHEYMRQHWTTSEPPLVYQLQVQHQLLVTGCRYGYLVASIGGQPPVWVEIAADLDMQRILMRTYRRFWDSVEGNYDLPADYSDVTSKAIAARYPKDNGTTQVLPADSLGWWKTRLVALEEIKRLDEAKDEASNNLKQAMGEATFGILPDGTRIKLAADKNGKRSTLREVEKEIAI